MRFTPMNAQVKLLAGVAFAAALLMSGCGSSNNSGGAGSTTSGAAPATSAATPATLKVAQDATYGSIIVDGKGFAVYMYDKDTASPSVSNCNGPCLTAWPAVVAASGTATGDGIMAPVATITRTDGTKQATVAGWPAYLYVKDTKAGDTTGQAVGGVWWLLKPDGTKITMKPPAKASASPSA